MLAPIILFVYNRPWHTRQTLEYLQKNLLSDQSDLFIYADGIKNDLNQDEKRNVAEVRKIIREKKWCKKVEIIEFSYNKGLSNSLMEGITEVVNTYGRVIVLEDDLVTSKYFLKFMNEALSKYESNENIVCISGYVYPVKEKLPDMFFLKGTDCWGWATWKKGWDIFEKNGKKLLNELMENRQTTEFDYNHSHPYMKILEDQIEEKNDSWAIRWYASSFLKNKLTLYPGNSFVQNIGTDKSGFHGGDTNVYKVNLSNQPLILKEIPMEENARVRGLFEKYYRTINKQKQSSNLLFEKIILLMKKYLNKIISPVL